MTGRKNLVGTPQERVEDARLLAGRGCYVDDLHVEGMLHAAIVRSSVAHGVLRGIDTRAAVAMPGVRAIYTGQDVARHFDGTVPKIPVRLAPIPQLEPFRQTAVALDRVRYVGEALAIVLADSAAQAEDAADQVLAHIDPLPIVADWRASARGEVKLFEDGNIPMTYVAQKGDAESATGPYVRKETFTSQRHSAIAMETRGLLAQWDGSRNALKVYGAAKVPFFTRDSVAKMMGLPRESVEMIELDVGGGFGVRGEVYAEDFLVPFAARQLDRPVKWIEDRRENLLAANHSREMECELEIVCEKNGRIVALRGSVAVDAGAYMRTSAPAPSRNVAQFMSGPYDIPNVRIQSRPHLTNKAPIGTYRGPGRYEGDFFRERLFDIAARDLGVDPVEFRRINLVKHEQIPYELPMVNGPDRFEELDSGDYSQTLARTLQEIRWDERKALQGKLVGGKYHGLGLACFIEGGAAGGKETARIDIEADGSLSLHVGSANVGQGLLTVLTQIAADELAVPMDAIRVFHGSTTHLKEGFGSFHSRSTVMGGSAVMIVARQLKDRIREAAAGQWGCGADDVAVGPGLVATCGARSLGLAELGRLGVRADGEFPSHDHTYSYGAAAAFVAVDPGTGKIDVLDYFVIEDMGRVINPLTANGQLVGAAAQGLGGAIMEHLAYDENAQFLAGTLADYLMPTADDFPSIRALAIGDFPSPHNPLGAKGAGEGGTVSAAGVIANAVSAALADFGVKANHLPLTPPTVWALIQQGAKQAAPA